MSAVEAALPGLLTLPRRLSTADTRRVNGARRLLSDDEVFTPLSEGDCRTLLASRSIGRVGSTNGGLPVILPVRYFYAADAITFRTARGIKLRAATSGDVLAFEVDNYDDATGEGWSVLVLGRAAVLSALPGTEPAGLGPVPEGDPRNSGDSFVRVQCEVVTGRRVEAARPGSPVTGSKRS